MASPDADASPRARSQWQRAVSAVAARDGTDAGPPSSDFSSVAAEATFVRRLNSRKSFSAAFGRRSLSGKVVKIVDDAELSRDAAPRSTAPRSSAPASPPPVCFTAAHTTSRSPLSSSAASRTNSGTSRHPAARMFSSSSSLLSCVLPPVYMKVRTDGTTKRKV